MENNRRKVNVAEIYQLSMSIIEDRYLKNVRSFSVIEDGEVLFNNHPMIKNYIELMELFVSNGMDIQSVDGISKYDGQNSRIQTLSDGTHLYINLGLDKMIRSILLAFQWMYKYKGLDLRRYELEFTYR